MEETETTTQSQTGTEGAPTAGAERTFTQAEVDAIVGERLSRARRDMPDEAELTQFRSWRAAQQTDADKLSAAQRERDTARGEAEQYRRQLVLLTNGVPKDDLEYYAFKIGRAQTEGQSFEDAAAAYLREHPVTQPEPVPQPVPNRVQFTAPMADGGGPTTKAEIMAIRDRTARRAAIAAHPELFNTRKE